MFGSEAFKGLVPGLIVIGFIAGLVFGGFLYLLYYFFSHISFVWN